MAGSSTETFSASSEGTYDVVNIKVEEDVDEIEESFIAIKKEEDIGIKQEKIPEHLSFPDIRSEPGKVSYVFVCMYVCSFIQYSV
jgi:hypothetical protein